MRLCFFGDSFVNGKGDPECLGWAGRLCAGARRQGHELVLYNLGIPRDTSADIRARWRAEAAVRLPPGAEGRLVFSFGVNDCNIENGRRRVDEEQALANAEAVLSEASAWHPTLFIGPPPIADDDGVNGHVRALSVAFGRLSARLGVPYLETFETLLRTDVWMREAAAGDGSHPAAAGYAAFAELVAGWAAWQACFRRA